MVVIPLGGGGGQALVVGPLKNMIMVLVVGPLIIFIFLCLRPVNVIYL